LSIPARVKEERERLGYSQTQFGAFVEVSKKTQIRWEQEGGAYPDAGQLSAWGELGLDMLYVLTGKRSNAAATAHLPPDEQLLLEAYRGMAASARKALLAELLTGGKKPKAKPKAPGEGSGINVSGSGHRVAGRDFNERKE
tara:strand:+ start:26137 stop:26559 length:423 start_codon:yes stop_codon:yes gene_type:complete